MHSKNVFTSLECQPNFPTKIDGKCLYFSSENKNAAEAQEYCRELGGHLFEPVDEQENRLVAQHMVKLDWHTKFVSISIIAIFNKMVHVCNVFPTVYLQILIFYKNM